MSSHDLSSYLEYLEDVGFFDIALPFLLVFTLTFAILQKITLFGPSGKKFNVVIAAVMAFLVIRSEPIVEVMNTFLPNISLLALIIVSFLLLVGLLMGRDPTPITQGAGTIAVILVLLGVGISFFSSSGALGLELPAWLDLTRVDFNFLLLIALGGLFIAIITGGKEGNDNTWGNFFNNFPNMFGNNPPPGGQS